MCFTLLDHSETYNELINGYAEIPEQNKILMDTVYKDFQMNDNELKSLIAIRYNFSPLSDKRILEIWSACYKWKLVKLEAIKLQLNDLIYTKRNCKIEHDETGSYLALIKFTCINSDSKCVCAECAANLGHINCFITNKYDACKNKNKGHSGYFGLYTNPHKCIKDAIDSNNISFVEYMLKTEMCKFHTEDESSRVDHYISSFYPRKHVEIIEEYYNRDDEAYYLLYRAAHLNNVPLLKLLIEYGYPVNKYVAMYAALNGSLDILRFLYANKYEIHLMCFTIACFYAHYDCVKFIHNILGHSIASNVLEFDVETEILRSNFYSILNLGCESGEFKCYLFYECNFVIHDQMETYGNDQLLIVQFLHRYKFAITDKLIGYLFYMRKGNNGSEWKTPKCFRLLKYLHKKKIHLPDDIVTFVLNDLKSLKYALWLGYELDHSLFYSVGSVKTAEFLVEKLGPITDEEERSYLWDEYGKQGLYGVCDIVTPAR